MTYKKLNKKDIDYNTFNDELGKSEIISIKNKTKDLYKFKHVYIYNEIYDIIYNIESIGRRNLVLYFTLSGETMPTKRYYSTNN